MLTARPCDVLSHAVEEQVPYVFRSCHLDNPSEDGEVVVLPTVPPGAAMFVVIIVARLHSLRVVVSIGAPQEPTASSYWLLTVADGASTQLCVQAFRKRTPHRSAVALPQPNAPQSNASV